MTYFYSLLFRMLPTLFILRFYSTVYIYVYVIINVLYTFDFLILWCVYSLVSSDHNDMTVICFI